jgi:hypothetical protein
MDSFKQTGFATGIGPSNNIDTSTRLDINLLQIAQILHC